MKKKAVIFILLLIAITFGVFFILNKNFYYKDRVSKKLEKNDEIIKDDYKNIKEINSQKENSEKFMEKYFEASKKIQEKNNKNNILIVTSKKKIENTYGATNIVEAPNNQYILQYDKKEDKEKAFKKLKDDNLITVEENIIHKITTSNYNSWGIEKTGLDYAINVSNTKNLNEVTVAIIDTGCDLDLFNKQFPNKLAGSLNILDIEESVIDTEGHGTHIAGTIAEGTPNNVKILPIKVSRTNDIYTTDIIQAINYIVYYNKADVINMSFGTYGYSNAEYEVIEAANKKNIISVAAAGNDNYAKEFYPAAFNNTISVSAVDSNLKKANFSNYGYTITFAAPGEDIVSINGTKSGTSMATPHAVSAVAILKSYNNEVTLDNTIDILKKYAIDLGDDGWDQYYGYGLINFKGTQFTDGEDTDKYGIFKNNVTNKLEAIDFETSNYNYGNITNLMNAQIKIYYNETEFYTKSLWELEDVQIIDYDPYSYTDQNVIIRYQNEETILKVNNKNAVSKGWEYRKNDDNTIYLHTFHHANNENNYPLKIYIPSKIDGYTVTYLQENLFNQEDNIKIKSVIIPTGVKEITGNIGLGKELEEIFLPTSLKKIGSNAFERCIKLKDISIPDSVEEINSYAFENSGIKSIVIPNKVTRICEGTFKNCSNLKEVILSEETEEIGNFAFENTKLSSINIPKKVNSIGKNPFFNVLTLKTIDIDKDNEKYTCYNDCNIIVEKSTNKLISANINSKLPSKIKTFGQKAFSGIISSLSIAEGLEKIEDYAFAGFNYEYFNKITLPRSLNKISVNAFKVLNNGKYEIPENLIIWVYKNSYAETYVKENNLNYNYLEIGPKKPSKITIEGKYIFNGKFQEVKIKEFNSNTMNISGNIQINAGTYKVYITPKFGEWEDGTTDAISATWKIENKELTYSNIILEYVKTNYNGTNKTPKVKLIADNKKLTKGTDYTVKYINNKNPGTAEVIIEGKGNYKGKITKKFTINPKGTNLSKLSAAKKKFTVKWKKQIIQTTGYQIQYSINNKFKNGNKMVTISKNKITSKSITKLKAKKKYYVRIRTYKKLNGKNYYSEWSKSKAITTKK